MELFDLFDKDRKPTGEIMQRGTSVPKDRYRQVVHIVIFNNVGEMLIQQRQSFKKLWPSRWDITTGGSVISGETSNQGAERELFEEIGVKVDFSSIRPVFTANFEGGFDDFYILNMDLDVDKLSLQEEEVQDAKWASYEEIKKLMDNDEFISYHNGVIELLFSLKNKHYGFIND